MRCGGVVRRTWSSVESTGVAWLMGALFGVALLVGAVPAAGQALHIQRLPNGTVFLAVSTPEATATSLAWPVPGTKGAPVIRALVRGDLGLFADAERALTGAGPAPPVVVGVGAIDVAALDNMLDRVLAKRPPAALPRTRPEPLEEGGIERRLEPPGTPATLRLSLPLPSRSSALRDSAEVLGLMIPGLVTAGSMALHSRLAPHAVLVEGDVDAVNGDEAVSRLRLALAQLSQAPNLDRELVAAARARLEVRRRARLEAMPGGATQLVSIWLEAGTDGVRRYLFGLDGVTVETVRRAANVWLASHPGFALLLLPPQALNPRFAAPPRSTLLSNGLNTVMLERPASDLTALTLRPILVPDFDCQGAALILTRLAAGIRSSGEAPGWIRVNKNPPELELATAPDDFPRLCEVLSGSLQKLSTSRDAVHPEPGPEHRALEMMAAVLGFPESGAMTPARLLQPSNLAVGAVVADAGTAGEALEKFLATIGGPAEGVHAQSILAAPKTRAPVPGGSSVMLVALPVGPSTPGPVADLAAGLVEVRTRAMLGDATVELRHPVVPGRRVELLEIGSVGQLDALGATLEKVWKKITARPGDAELEPLQRTLAAHEAARGNGALGASRLCAAQAAGVGTWRPSGGYERAIISLGPDDLEPVLKAWRDFTSLKTTGAGPFPVTDLPPAAR